MTSNDDLNKLFEAALGGKQAPSRYGTPEEQARFSPVPTQQNHQAVSQPSQFQAAPTQAPVNNFQSAPAQHFQAAPVQQHPPANAFQPAPTHQQPSVNAFQPAPEAFSQPPAANHTTLDDRGQSSLDTGISAELGAILDAKVAKAKRKRRRGLVLMVLFFVTTIGGAAGWVVSNPERYDAMKNVVAEIKSVGDIKGMVAEYQKALDKVAVRSQHIDAATVSMGIDPTSADNMEDQGFDKEMREMMGEDAGPTTAARNEKLQKKFKHLQEGGTLQGGAAGKNASE